MDKIGEVLTTGILEGNWFCGPSRGGEIVSFSRIKPIETYGEDIATCLKIWKGEAFTLKATGHIALVASAYSKKGDRLAIAHDPLQEGVTTLLRFDVVGEASEQSYSQTAIAKQLLFSAIERHLVTDSHGIIHADLYLADRLRWMDKAAPYYGWEVCAQIFLENEMRSSLDLPIPAPSGVDWDAIALAICDRASQLSPVVAI